MRRIRLAGPTLALLLLAACTPAGETSSEAPGLSEEEVATIRDASSQWAEAVQAGDLDRVASLYAEDAVLMPPGAPVVEGRSAIRDFLNGFPEVESASFTHHEIEGRGDLAYVRGSYEITMLAVPGDTASTVTDRGKFLEIRERQDDGSWPMIVDVWNSSGAAADTADGGM